jgi:hypothetical protein
MSAEPKLTAYLAVLESRGWVWVPMARDTGISYFAHGAYLLDRIQVFRGRWSHCRFDGTSWLTDARAYGVDAASLDAYLTKHFRRG